MTLTDRAFAALHRALPAAEPVDAHCDIPCAIYDPHAAQVAALTVVRMFQLMKDLPESGSGAEDRAKYVNSMTEWFWQSKGAQTRRQPSMQQAGGEFVVPVPS